MASNDAEANSAVQVYLQVGPDDGEDWLLLVVLSRLLEQPFFEDLRTRHLPFREALHEAMSGTIRDALTVAMLLRAYYMAMEGELDETLAAAMLQR